MSLVKIGTVRLIPGVPGVPAQLASHTCPPPTPPPPPPGFSPPPSSGGGGGPCVIIYGEVVDSHGTIEYVPIGVYCPP